ncbi:uncharacterized protein LOC115764386 [Drosophila novamexicana]|uniref:uncharacterized protein LOC115764386 n=1 Tax=Drosophila novamexicana TaxID=47314 RepID=UPI0011E60143|nr:uncharacterized protein LOC115764386 [Drosophila novamexicana]
MLLVYARAEDRSYSVELNSFKNMSKSEVDVELFDWGTLRTNHVARNKYTLDGDIEFKRNMGNEQAVSLLVHAYKEDTKMIGPLMLIVNKRFCQFVNEKSNLPEQDCSFPKGKYTIDNYELETTFLTNITLTQ